MAKAFAMKIGSAIRPSTIPSSKNPFSEINIPNNSVHLIPDGNDLLLVKNGDSNNVEIDPFLRGVVFTYHNITRATYPGVAHVDAGIIDLTMTQLGEPSPIRRTGIIDCNSPIMLGGKTTSLYKNSYTFVEVLNKIDNVAITVIILCYLII